MVKLVGDFSKITKTLQRIEREFPQKKQKAINRTLLKARAVVDPLVPVDNATLRKSGTIQTKPNEGKLFYNTDYAEHVHEGTGIYGPTGRRIRPRRARALRFNVGGATIYAKSVRGQKGQPYLRDGINQNIRQIADTFCKAIEL